MSEAAEEFVAALTDGMRLEFTAGEAPAGPVQVGIQVCFCDRQGRPATDWDSHEGSCLMLDWALANGMMTYAEWSRRFAVGTAELGITGDEIEAEARELPCDSSGHQHAPAGGRCRWCDVLLYPAYSRQRSRRPEPVALPPACYASEYGFTVHVKGACECRRR
jgi:hypothetical protein